MSEISAYRDGYTLGKHSMRTAAYEWGFEKGEQAERERIIKLIEDSIRECECVKVGMNYCRHRSTELEIIALIKGENK